MAAVVNCILALKDRYGQRASDEPNLSFLTRCDSEGGRKHMGAKLQRVLTSPVMSGENCLLLVIAVMMISNKFLNRFNCQLNFFLSSLYSEPSSPSIGADLYSPSGIFQMKQGGYSDLPGCKISDLMKSSSLDVSTVLQTLT